MAGHGDIKQAIAALTGRAQTLDIAKPHLPKTGGLYAWWIHKNALAGVPVNKHPTEQALDLLYVGIAPSGVTSKSTLRSRVVGNHMRGNIAASTLRRTLAALLIHELRLTPIKKGTKVILPRHQNAQLSAWQQMHLRLTWHETQQPWLIEAGVIAALQPPLNLADNGEHPFFPTLSAARKALQQAAR